MKNSYLIHAFILILFLFNIGMNACTHKSEQDINQNISFNKEIIPVLTANCAINSNCHIGSYNFNDHVDLDSNNAYYTLITRGLVNTQYPTASILYTQINGGIMPKYPASKLSDYQITIILNWIKQGAINN